MQIITNSFIKPNEHHLITFSTFSSCFIRKPVPQEHCFDHRADGYTSYEYSSVTDSELQCYEAGTHGCMHGVRFGLCLVFCVVVAIFTIVTRRTSNTSVVNTTLVVKARYRRSWNYTYGSYSIFITTAWHYYFSSKFNMNLPRKLTSQFAEICSMNVKNMGRTTADRNGKFNFKFQMLM